MNSYNALFIDFKRCNQILFLNIIYDGKEHGGEIGIAFDGRQIRLLVS